ncbi:MAG: MBL fold metallo-hydrolase [Bacilli bacterium]
MRYYILASGSKGNATVLECKQGRILIDLGLPLGDFSRRLSEFNLTIDDIDAVFYTHSHTDHFIRAYKRIDKHKIYATKETFNHPDINFIEPYESYQVAGFTIFVLPISHDAENPVGFVIDDGKQSLVYMTDTGYISDQNIGYMKNKTYYIIEANHNERMLLQTSRPYVLIQRILGDKGHLSNEASAHYVAEMVGENTKEIVLAHLSEEANTPEVALAAFHKILPRKDVDISRIQIKAAKQYLPVSGGSCDD